MATDRQRAHAAISYFLKLYKEKFHATPYGFNRHALVHGFESLVKDYSGQENKIIDYYFENYVDPSPNQFVYQYGKVVEGLQEDAEDQARLKELKRKTKERMMNVINRREGN